MAYHTNVEPNAEDEAQHVYVTVTDTDTKEVYEGRLPLTNAGQPDPEPAICSPLTKLGLTATTMAHFVAMARYVVETGAIVEGLRGGQAIDMVTAIAKALKAYAEGDRQ